METRKPRKLLGKANTFGVRRKVFLREDCFEIDEISLVELARTRVFFDDVLAVTLHKKRFWLIISITFFLGLIFALVGIALLSAVWLGSLFFFSLAALMSVIFIVQFVLKTLVVGIQGRRTTTELFFSVRRKKGRQTYSDLIRLLSAVQERMPAPSPFPTQAPDEENLESPDLSPPAPQNPENEELPPGLAMGEAPPPIPRL